MSDLRARRGRHVVDNAPFPFRGCSESIPYTYTTMPSAVGVRSSGKLIQVSVASVINHQRISAYVLVRALIGVVFLLIPTLPYWRFHITHIYSTAYTHE